MVCPSIRKFHSLSPNHQLAMIFIRQKQARVWVEQHGLGDLQANLSAGFKSNSASSFLVMCTADHGSSPWVPATLVGDTDSVPNPSLWHSE